MQALTGATAILRIQGEIVGLAESVDVNFNYSRSIVKQLGSTKTVEAPHTDYNGQINLGFTFINLEKYALARYTGVTATSQLQAENNLVLDSNIGVSISLFKKTQEAIDLITGDRTAEEKIVMILPRVMIDSSSFTVSNGQVSTSSTSGIILDYPVLPKN